MIVDKLKRKIESIKEKMREEERIFRSLIPPTYGWDDSICPPSCPEDRDMMYVERRYQKLNRKLSKYQVRLLRLTA